MPTYNKVVKEPVYVFSRDAKGNKQHYKTGPLKGQVKRVIKTPGKTRRMIDVPALVDVFNGADIIVIEDQGTTAGNSARSSRTTSINYGKVLACAELSGAQIVIVQPQTWKKYFKLSKDKYESLELYTELSGRTVPISKDGLAEAYLIREFFIKELR